MKMSTLMMANIRKIIAGKVTGVVLVVLLLAMATIPNFVLTYYPIAMATFVRNMYLPTIGTGAIFYLIALIGVYIEAVLFSVIYQLLTFSSSQIGRQYRETK